MLIKLTHAHIIGTVIAYLIGVCLVPLVISFSKKEGLVDVPNERKIHTKPISRIGGVAIWASTMLTFVPCFHELLSVRKLVIRNFARRFLNVLVRTR